MISESNGILFLAVLLAHEITHAINLSRSINNANVVEKNTPKLILFCSYSDGGDIDAGNLTERMLLDGELHLSKPPPTPPVLFLIVSASGTQIPLSKEVVEECINKRSFAPISQSINSHQYIKIRQLTSTDSRKGSAGKLPILEQLFSNQKLTFDSDPTSPIIPMLTSMMHAQ